MRGPPAGAQISWVMVSEEELTTFPSTTSSTMVITFVLVDEVVVEDWLEMLQERDKQHSQIFIHLTVI